MRTKNQAINQAGIGETLSAYEQVKMALNDHFRYKCSRKAHIDFGNLK